jgi:hypothetical protein
MSTWLAIIGWYIVVGVLSFLAGWGVRWYWIEKRGHTA